jgi:hypothetical protein
MPPRAEYVLIIGHGRSGTNWLLDLLNISSHTLCRNEPDQIAASPLAKLSRASSPMVPGGDLSALEDGWDAAVQWTATHMGETDPPLIGPKNYLFEFSRGTGLTRLLNYRSRRIASRLFPSLRGSEWELPFWVGDRAAMAHALPVVKLVQAPIWSVWVLANRSTARVLHIVRHPGGFLNSWKNRYLKRHSIEAVARANQDRLEAIVRVQPKWGKEFGDLAAMLPIESELWYWRYSTETIHAAGHGRPQYALVIYEHLAFQTLAEIRRLFDACGLEWNERVEHSVKRLSNASADIAAAWKSRLQPEEIHSIERVLAGSPMEAWWI